MVPWWLTIVTMASGMAIGAGMVAFSPLRRMYREMRQTDADMDRRRAELEAKMLAGCRRGNEQLQAMTQGK